MFPEPTELLLIGCLIESIWTLRSKSNTLTPKTNSQTHWQREISHVMSGTIFCVCSTLAISVLPNVLKWCRKERKKMQVKKESQQSRSRWWIWSRDTVWGIRTCLPRLHRKARDNQIWKSERTSELVMQQTSTRRLVSNKLVIDNDMVSDTATESDLSLKSRSFLDRVNDRLRKMLNRSPEDSMQDIDKRSMIWWMFVFDSGNSCINGKELLRQFTFIKNTWDNLTLKKMLEISEQLILEQSDEIFGVSHISWESSPWKQLSLVNDEEVISLSHAKVYVFSDSVLCLGKMKQNAVWERQLEWFKGSSQYRILVTIDGEPMEFVWNIFTRIHYIGACPSSPKVHEQNWRTWTIQRANYLHVDVQWHHMEK